MSGILTRVNRRLELDTEAGSDDDDGSSEGPPKVIFCEESLYELASWRDWRRVRPWQKPKPRRTLEGYRGPLRLKPLKFSLDKTHLVPAIKGACRSFTGQRKGLVCGSDLRILALLPRLPPCPNKRKKVTVCRCIELSQMVPSTYQDDIRKTYVEISKEGNHDMANEFLISMIFPKQSSMVSTQWKPGQHQMQFIVPCFQDNKTVRQFKLCSGQFKRLFGLTQHRLGRLMRLRKEEIPSIVMKEYYSQYDTSHERLMGWSRGYKKYRIGDVVWDVVSDNKYTVHCEWNNRKSEKTVV